MTADAYTHARTTPAAPQPRPGLMNIRPYKGGESGLAGVERVVKLSSNENVLGCSPKAREAFTASGAHLELYPDGSATGLRQAIAAHHGLDANAIICGAGSDEILQLLARGFAGPGDEILFCAHGFLVYRLAAMQVGATPVAAPERDLTADVDALLARVTERTRIVFIANPNNPTGTYIDSATLARLHAGLPAHVLLVVDGAYAEYVRRPDYDSGLALAQSQANVVATRTFSKIHGLAALRLGWAVGPQAVIEVLHRLRGPFNIGSPALAAGTAAIEDTAFATAAADHNDAELAYVSEAMTALGLLACPSVGNFVLLRFASTPGKTADDADIALRTAGIIARKVAAYGLADCLRVTLGRREDNARVIDTLRAFLQAP